MRRWRLPVPARLESLTGLRFLAAMLVLLYHVSIFWQPPDPLRLGSAGLTGVSFFFVLSGFVLMWSRRPDDPPTTFWWHRFARVWPLHALTFLLALAVVPAVGAGGSLLNLALLQGWYPDIEISHGLNQPSWSLSAEAFFYALFPILAITVSRARPRTVLLGVTAGMLTLAVLGLALADGQLLRWLLYTCPLYRLGEFVAGMGLAVAVRSGWRPPLPLGAALAACGTVYLACAYFLAENVLPFTYSAVMAVMFALVIGAAAARDIDLRGSILSSRCLVLLGKWSFALYLVHWPVFVVAERATDAWWSPVAAVALAIALAAVLFTWFERPVERWLRARQPARQAQAPSPAPARA